MDPIEALKELQEERTQEWQEWMLSRLPEEAFVRESRNVKGKYTTGPYVIWLLNLIFGPSNWSHTVLKGPEIVTLNEGMAYSQVTVRVTAKFANGEVVTHDDVGMWTFAATGHRDGGTLADTSPERYEQVLKSAITDGVKACSEYFGTCFRPIPGNEDGQELQNFLRRRQESADLKIRRAAADEPPEDPKKSASDLFGDPDPVVKATEEMGAEVAEEKPTAAIPQLGSVNEFWTWALDQGLVRDDILKVINDDLGDVSITDYIAEVGDTEAGLDFATKIAATLLA